MVGPSGEADPLPVGHKLRHVDTQSPPSLLNRGAHPGLPFIESLPSGLNGPDDSFLEMSRVLLHDDDGFLKSVLFGNLLLQLPVDGQVDGEGVFLGTDAHGSVGDGTDRTSQISDGFGGEFSFTSDGSGEFTGIVLNVLDVSLDLGSELLEVLNDGRVDRSSQRGVRVGNDPGLVSDGVEDVL